jgi:hypothetical protein
MIGWRGSRVRFPAFGDQPSHANSIQSLTLNRCKRRSDGRQWRRAAFPHHRLRWLMGARRSGGKQAPPFVAVESSRSNLACAACHQHRLSKGRLGATPRRWRRGATGGRPCLELCVRTMPTVARSPPVRFGGGPARGAVAGIGRPPKGERDTNGLKAKTPIHTNKPK